MVNARSVALPVDVDGGEVGRRARRAGVAAIEEAGAASHALMGHEVGVVAQYQVVDERDLFGHGSHFPLRCRRTRYLRPGSRAYRSSPAGETARSWPTVQAQAERAVLDFLTDAVSLAA